MTGRPVLAERTRENVLLPAPDMPVTTTRRPTARSPGLLLIEVDGIAMPSECSWRAAPVAVPRGVVYIGVELNLAAAVRLSGRGDERIALLGGDRRCW